MTISSARPKFTGRLDWLFRGALLKAWLAFRAGRLPLSPTWWFRALMLHWREPVVRPREAQAMDRERFNDSYRRWCQHQRAPQARKEQERSRTGVSLSVIALVDSLSNVSELLNSIQRQNLADKSWLVLAGDSPDRLDPHIGSIASIAIGRATDWIRPDKSWLPPGRGSHVVFLDGRTLLPEGICARLLEVLTARGEADWIYTDEDRIDDRGFRSDPYLKGAFNLPLALVDDYATRLAVVRRSTIEEVGGLRPAYGDAQIYELFLRIAMAGARIEHLPEIGCHQQGLASAGLSEQHQKAAERVVFGDAVPARVDRVNLGTSDRVAVHRVSWRSNPAGGIVVTIVIPTRDRLDLLRGCIESLRHTVDLSRTRILIVDDQSRDEETHAYLQLLETDDRLRCRVVRPMRTDGVFNYARLMNIAVQRVETPLVLHLNNDIRAMAPGWLDQMAGWMSFPDVGIVGAKLIYPDDSIQHAGVVVSPGSGALEHFQSDLRAGDAGYRLWPHLVREVSAVTGACLLTSTELFRSLGGFDEQHFAVQFNDTDFCLRARGIGKRVVYEPGAVLYHLASASRGGEFDYGETLRFLKKYAGYRDPFISPHLDAVSICGPTPKLA